MYGLSSNNEDDISSGSDSELHLLQVCCMYLFLDKNLTSIL